MLFSVIRNEEWRIPFELQHSNENNNKAMAFVMNPVRTQIASLIPFKSYDFVDRAQL